MSDYNTFDSQIQCDEQINVTAEEQEEVFQLMAEEADGFHTYGEWSEQSEQATFEQKEENAKDWLNGYGNRQPGPKAGSIDI